MRTGSWWTLLSISILLAFSSCKKDVPIEEIDLGYEYFPQNEGRFIIYAVDSTGYGIETVSESYEIKEWITNPYLDNEGQEAYELHRFKRSTTSSPWQLIDVWNQKRTTTSAERTEDNQRYVKLVFPAKQGESWDGNAYNPHEEWEYSYGALDTEQQVGPFLWTETVTVQQRNRVNLIDEEIASEIYARGIGMIYKQLIDKNTQGDVTTGFELEMTVSDVGFE